MGYTLQHLGGCVIQTPVVLLPPFWKPPKIFPAYAPAVGCKLNCFLGMIVMSVYIIASSNWLFANFIINIIQIDNFLLLLVHIL